MNFQSFKTNIGYCHIDKENVIFSLDNDIEIVSDSFIVKHNGKKIVKFILAVILFLISYDSFNNDKKLEGFLMLILGIFYLYDIFDFIKKWNYFIKKRISKKTIQKISGEKIGEIRITYLSDKNQIETFRIKISENQVEKENILKAINNKNGY